MSISSARTATSVSITGATQSADTAVSIMGIVDQIIVTSTEENQTFDLELSNYNGDIILPAHSIDVERDYILRPALVPRGVVTITISNPLPSSGTVTVTLIERERGS